MKFGKFIKAILHNKPLTPVLFLSVILVSTIANALYQNKNLLVENYVALGVMVVNYFIYFTKRKFYPYLLGVSLVLGMLNLIIYTPGMWRFGFYLNNLNVYFQPQSFFALLLAFIVYYKWIIEFLQRTLKVMFEPESEEKYNKLVFDEKVLKFKEKYTSYSSEILNSIIVENRLVPEAIEAAKQVLNQRIVSQRS